MKPKLLNLTILSCLCNGCEIYFTLLLIIFYLPDFYFASLATLVGRNCFTNYLSNEITFAWIALYCFNSCSSVEARLIIGCRTYLAFNFDCFCNLSLNLLWSFILWISELVLSFIGPNSEDAWLCVWGLLVIAEFSMLWRWSDFSLEFDLDVFCYLL